MQKKSRSFKKELIYSFLTITLISMVILGLFQIYQLSSLIDENQKNQIQTTKFLEDYIYNYIQEHQRAIESRAEDIKADVKKGDHKRIRERLRSIYAEYPGFVNLYVGNEDGQSLTFYPKKTEDGNMVKSQDFSNRQYYKNLLEKKETVTSSVFMGRGGTDKLLVTVATPLLDDTGNMTGYVLGALDLSFLEEHIENRQFGKEGYAVVLDQNNNVIVHPDIDTQEQVTDLSDNPIAEYIDDQNSGAGGKYFTQTKDDSEEEYITYEVIQALDGWTVWVGKPASVISNTYTNSIITIVIVIILTSIVMVGLSLLLTNRLQKSIRKLLDYIKAYTRGYKEKQFVTRDIEGPREMQELSHHFNHMIHEIQSNRSELIQLNADLESRVQARTADLEIKNRELRSVNKLITSVSTDKDILEFIQYCLKQIVAVVPHPIYILYHKQVITYDNMKTIPDLKEYINHFMTRSRVHTEKISIASNDVGYLLVDLNEESSMNEDHIQFLQTFASSLAIMLQNKQLFERYRNKHAEIDAILESMSEGLLLLNNERQVNYVNDFFKTEAAKKDESTTPDLDHINDVYRLFMDVFNVDEDQLNEFFEHDHNNLKVEKQSETDKKKYYMLHKFLVITDNEQIGEGLLLRDITKEEEIDTLKNNLISLTSHEFKTPITNIKGSVETLLRSEVEWDAEFQNELLEGVNEDIERIQHLVNDWMDISKIESSTMYIDPNYIRSDSLIEESIDQVPGSMREDASFSFNNQMQGDPYVYVDKRRAQQVLINLFTNALRYNDEEVKEIQVTLDSTEDEILISVADNGIGVSRDHIEKIFDRFYQVDITATRRSGGTGLGLAICSGIMQAHNGRIEVNSIPEEGSTFTLHFPK